MNNKILLKGRWTTDPELNYLGKDELACLQCRIAVPDYSRKKGNDEYHVDYFDVTVMGDKAELFCKRCGKKGEQVLITGKLRTTTYKNEDNQNRVKFEIRASSIDVLASYKNSDYYDNDNDDYDDDEYRNSNSKHSNRNSSRRTSRNRSFEHDDNEMNNSTRNSRVKQNNKDSRSRVIRTKSIAVNWDDIED